ncbi:MAG TPA: CPBP family intramembrane glutamic endopeptidase [Streptosporangiaceae bacterium]|jgi:membrane protease YdiL (CAAX protease family)|nr:CPBP family intramembrane glutamic endopeptidase [Streptosporangiaceae bacterium]
MSDGQDPAGAPLAEASTASVPPPAPNATPVTPVTAGTPATATATAGRWVLPTRRLLWWEIIAVFGVSLGGSGLYAFVDLIGSLTATKSLGKQTATLNGSLAPGRPTLDLFLQLTNTLLGVAPVVLALYLIAREGESPSVIGLDGKRPGQDLLRGAIVAAVIGGIGLAWVLAAFHLGFNLNVVAESLPNVWWRIPVLILSAFQNGLLEEVLVIGFLLRRLDQLGFRSSRAIALSATLRGSYHLYQGFGGFLGNAAMGVVFGLLYRRWGRVTPLVIAHTLIDMGAFIGYAELHGHVSWLP